MIEGYEVKNINNENVLILYLNYDSEFGMDFRLRHKNINMKQEIKKFIKQKNIKFDGEKIALSLGGIVLAVLLLVETPNPPDDIKLTYVSDNIIPNEIVEVVDTNIKEEIEKPIINEEIKDVKQEQITEDNKEVILNNKTEENIKPNNTTNQVIKPEYTNQSTNKNTNNNEQNNIKEETPTINKQESENFEKQETTNEKEITVYRTNGTILNLSMDEYLIGVVGAEMPASFNIEALKAQAIVARTYALKKIESGGKLTDSVSTQRYKDNNELKKDWGSSFDNYYQKIKNAVESTKDQAIYYQGNLIDAVYHSTSNGKTEDSVYVWGNSIPYLKSVDSSWDTSASSYLRETSKDFNNVLTLLGIDIREDISFEILSRDNSGRVLEIKVGDEIFSGIEFRTLLGLRSTDFDLTLENNTLNITTRGYGHGVGMSQYGANGMAKQGYTYDKILKHYYTGVSIY